MFVDIAMPLGITRRVCLHIAQVITGFDGLMTLLERGIAYTFVDLAMPLGITRRACLHVGAWNRLRDSCVSS